MQDVCVAECCNIHIYIKISADANYEQLQLLKKCYFAEISIGECGRTIYCFY